MGVRWGPRQVGRGPGGPRHAHLEGFDLHADVWVPANNRERLEQLCCDVLRPPLAEDRLGLLADGRVRVALKRRAFGLDVLRCPRCAGRMQLMAAIDAPAVIQRILAHLGLAGARAGPPSPSSGASRAAGPP